MLSGLALKTKITLFAIAMFIALSAIALLGLQSLRHASESDNIARINQLMKSTTNIVEQFELMVKNNQLEEAQAKKLAIQVLRENKYHDSEYVYVVDNNLDFVATPHDPELHGTSFNDFKDASGNSIGRMVEKLVGNTTNKIITYHWDSVRDGETVDLTSVVQKTPLFGWYVVDERYWNTAKWLLGLSMLIAIALTFAIARFGSSLTNALGGEIDEVIGIVKNVSRGNLNSHIRQDAPPESIIAAMHYMQQGLRGVVGGIKGVTDSLKNQSVDNESRSVELDKLTRSLNEETQMVASAITELTASAQTVVEHAEQAAYSVQEAEQQGQSASHLTSEAADTIALLEQQIDSAGNNIQVLDDEVNNIANVLSVIQGIAEQTNLLALNAPVQVNKDVALRWLLMKFAGWLSARKLVLKKSVI